MLLNLFFYDSVMDINWNILDIIIAIAIAYGFIQGLRHGLIKELSSIISILAGILLAKKCSGYVSDAIMRTFSWDESVCVVLSYVLVFVVTAALVNLLVHLITKLLKYAMLGWLNRLLGCVFGTLKITLIVSVILNVVSYCHIAGDAASKSMLFKPIAGLLEKVIPFADLDKLPDIKLPDIKLPEVLSESEEDDKVISI
jgi:membrane protein required for colicin V production